MTPKRPRARMVAALLPLLLLLGAPSGAAADPAPFAQLAAEELIVRGDATVTGELVGATHNLLGPSTVVGLDLLAERVKVANAYVRYFSVAGANPAGVQDERGVEWANFTNADGRTLTPAEDNWWGVFADPGAARVTFETTAGRLSEPKAEEVKEHRFVSTGLPMQSRSTSMAQQWEDDEGTSLVVIEGSFALSLYAWDLLVDHEGGEETVRSGTHEEERGMGPGGSLPATSNRQAYLYVTNGTLTIHALGRLPLVYLAGTQLSTAGDVLLRSVSGEFEGGEQEVSAESIELKGVLTISVRPSTTELLQLSIAGALEAASADGNAVQWTAPVDRQASGWSWLWILVIGAAAVPAGIGGLGWARQRVNSHRMSELEDEVGRGDHEAVIRRADRLVHTRDFGADAAAAKVESLLKLGRFDEAQAFLDSLPLRGGEAGLMLQFLRSYLLAVRGQSTQAAKILEPCLRANPELVREVAQSPAFDQVRRDPRIAKVLRRQRTDDPTAWGYA